jgi:hypothetical protein
MVTVPLAGAVAGAVYVVATPLLVEDGLNEPQEPEGVQLQFTPAAAESLATFAVIIAVPPAARAVGGDPAAKVTTIAGGGGGVLPPPPPPPQAQRNVRARMNRGASFQRILSPEQQKRPAPLRGVQNNVAKSMGKVFESERDGWYDG